MNIAILGLGTVGTGVVELLQTNREKISGTLGETLTVSHVYVNNLTKQRTVDLTGVTITDDINTIYNSDIDLVIEVMGGIDGTYQILQKFLKKGVHVVTANKDLLALHIDDLSQLANQQQVTLAYEASVAGGIPVIRGIQTGLNSNQLTQVLGILNGTSNYILTRMTQDGWDYQTALTKAQELGYAEADPTNDVEGFDAQRKIALLSRLAYEKVIKLDEVKQKGISSLELVDLDYARQAGLVMKLLGKSRYDVVNQTVSVNVEPVLLPMTHQLAHVNDAMNSVFVKGNGVGEMMFYGPGAGGLATASAVVSDVMNIVTAKAQGDNFVPTELAQIVEDQTARSYYVRLAEKPSGLAWLGEILSQPEAEQFVATTVVMTPAELSVLEKEATVLAAYPIEGKEWVSEHE